MPSVYTMSIVIKNAVSLQHSVESRKRKALEWERQFEGIRKAINDVAEAIREGNDVIEKTVECVHSEE